MDNKTEKRGRPAINTEPMPEKFERVFFQYEHEKVRDQGNKTTYFYDVNKTKNGPYKTETVYPKDFQLDEDFKIVKNRPYNGESVSVVYKTKKQQIQIKTYVSKSIDEILTYPESLCEIPKDAEWLDVGVGELVRQEFIKKYNIKP
jgi:hypothetical protein